MERFRLDWMQKERLKWSGFSSGQTHLNFTAKAANERFHSDASPVNTRTAYRWNRWMTVINPVLSECSFRRPCIHGWGGRNIRSYFAVFAKSVPFL